MEIIGRKKKEAKGSNFSTTFKLIVYIYIYNAVWCVMYSMYGCLLSPGDCKLNYTHLPAQTYSEIHGVLWPGAGVHIKYQIQK